MKKEEKMRKKIVGFMIAGMLILVFGLASTPAKAELSLGLVGGYYSPNFGKINDDFDDMNAFLGTDFEFKAGMLYGLALDYGLPPRFTLRLEYCSFESKTSDDYWVGSSLFGTHWEDDYKLTVTPVIFSVLYSLSPAYVGVGLGSFPTKLKNDWEWEDYFLGFVVDSSSGSFSDSDTPTGFVLLGGFEFGGESPFLDLEARYVVGTKAKLEDWHTEVDLSGLQLSLLAGFKF